MGEKLGYDPSQVEPVVADRRDPAVIAKERREVIRMAYQIPQIEIDNLDSLCAIDMRSWERLLEEGIT